MRTVRCSTTSSCCAEPARGIEIESEWRRGVRVRVSAAPSATPLMLPRRRFARLHTHTHTHCIIASSSAQATRLHTLSLSAAAAACPARTVWRAV